MKMLFGDSIWNWAGCLTGWLGCLTRWADWFRRWSACSFFCLRLSVNGALCYVPTVQRLKTKMGCFTAVGTLLYKFSFSQLGSRSLLKTKSLSYTFRINLRETASPTWLQHGSKFDSQIGLRPHGRPRRKGCFLSWVWVRKLPFFNFIVSRKFFASRGYLRLSNMP